MTMGAATASLADLPSLADVLAVGARTPLGLDAAQTGMLLRSGFAAFAPAALGPEGEDVTMAYQTDIGPTRVGTDRMIDLARPAMNEALARFDEHSAAERGLRAGLLLCVDDADERPALVSTLARQVNETFAAECQLEVVTGGSGGTCFALANTLAQLHQGELDVIVLGGVHSHYDGGAIARLIAEDRLYSSDSLDATIPGESAAFVVLSSPGKRHGHHVIAKLNGFGSGTEVAGPGNDEPAALARGITKAMRQATAPMENLGLRAGWLIHDVTFEMYRTLELQSLLVRASNVLGKPYRVEAPAQRMGAMGAASMPVAIAMCAEAWRAGYGHSPLSLVLSGSESGERSVLILSNPH